MGYPKAGQIFMNPDNSGDGYKCIRDVSYDGTVNAHDLEPIGNSPNPIPGETIPAWFDDIRLNWSEWSKEHPNESINNFNQS